MGGKLRDVWLSLPLRPSNCWPPLWLLLPRVAGPVGLMSGEPGGEIPIPRLGL